MKESLLQKLRMLRLKDIGHLFLFFAALLPAWLYKKKRAHLWLVCETGTEARDNGYWLFKYLCEQQPQVDAVYAISTHSEEFRKVSLLGNVVEYGSFRHWIYYLAAEVNISSQKYGKPNAAVCYLMEVVLGWLKNTRVFLQHGVTQNDLPFLHRDKAKLSLFCCAAKPEYEFIRDTFGYPEEVARYVGFCRFDGLHDCKTDKDLLLIVPTWRMWLQRQKGSEGEQAFLESEYYKHWSSLLNSQGLDALLRRYGKHAVFCLHRNMAVFEAHMASRYETIQILSWQDADVSQLIRRAGTLITDFSSIYMDFAYMKKPLAYYQFDLEEFRKGHLPKGYFEYERDGFGPVCTEEAGLLETLEAIFQQDCRMVEEYENRVDRFYILRDDKNCERTYEAINELLMKGKSTC